MSASAAEKNQIFFFKNINNYYYFLTFTVGDFWSRNSVTAATFCAPSSGLARGPYRRTRISNFAPAAARAQSLCRRNQSSVPHLLRARFRHDQRRTDIVVFQAGSPHPGERIKPKPSSSYEVRLGAESILYWHRKTYTNLKTSNIRQRNDGETRSKISGWGFSLIN